MAESGPAPALTREPSLSDFPSRDTVLAKFTKNGVLSMRRSQKEIQRMVRIHSTLRRFERVRQKVGDKTRELAALQKVVEQEQRLVQVYSQAALKVEAQLVELKQRTDIMEFRKAEPLAQLELRHQEAAAKLAEQQQKAQSTSAKSFAVEKERDAASAAVAANAPEEMKLKRTREMALYEERVVAEHANKMASDAVDRDESSKRNRAEENKRQDEEEQRLAHAEFEAAEEGEKKTKLRLHKDLATAKRRKQDVDRFLEQQHAERVAAVLQLKRSSEQSVNAISGANEARAYNKEKREQKRHHEKLELLAAGQNPYAVFGVRDQERLQKEASEKIARQIVGKKMGLLDRIIAEDAAFQKLNAAQDNHARHMEEYRKKMGRSIVVRKQLEIEAAQRAASSPKAAAPATAPPLDASQSLRLAIEKVDRQAGKQQPRAPTGRSTARSPRSLRTGPSTARSLASPREAEGGEEEEEEEEGAEESEEESEEEEEGGAGGAGGGGGRAQAADYVE